jgi:hypothetical protein
MIEDQIKKDEDFFMPKKDQIEQVEAPITKVKGVSLYGDDKSGGDTLEILEEVKTEVELRAEEEALPISVRERRQTV